MSDSRESEENGEDDLDARILIVDDKESFRTLTRAILEQEGYKTVDEAAAVRDALSKLTTGEYDVAIVDIQIGEEEEGGIKLLREMKRVGIETQAIVTSVSITTENQREAFKAGTFDVIPKGDDFNTDLLEAIPKAIEEKARSAGDYRRLEGQLGIDGLERKVRAEQHFAAMHGEEISETEALSRIMMPRVLIVYDNDDNRDMLEGRLREEFNVVSARNLVDAKKVMPFGVDLILMDVLLEETFDPADFMGIELVRAFRADDPKVPVVLTYNRNGLGADDIKERAIAVGASNYTAIDELLETKIKEAIVKKQEEVESTKEELESGPKKSEHGPYMIVFSGPSCSGKTTTALAVERILNKREEETVYIGNIKTGKPRKDENVECRDEYVSEERADELERDTDFSVYRFLGRRYFSKDTEILEALQEGKNVILVRNIDGLKVAGELLYKYKGGIDAKLISFKLHAGEDELKQRLRERVESVGSITEEEHRERRGTLERTIVEHARAPIDCIVSTNQTPEGTQLEAVNFLDWVDGHHPISLHYEFSIYARDMMRRLTDNRFYRRIEFERELDREPFVIEADSVSPKIIKAEGHKGIYTFYLAPFYSKEKLDPKQVFISYLEELFGEKAQMQDPAYGPDPVSTYAQSKVSYRNNQPIRVDDVALFTLKKGISAQFAGDEYHTIAFVCLEKEPTGRIKVRGL
jgi:DNA-binding NtrC family response regulator